MKSLAKHFSTLLMAFIAFAIFFNSCNSTTKKKDEQVVEEVKPPLPPGNDKNISYLNVDTLQSLIKSTPTFTITGKFKTPFDKLVFNKVMAYDFDGSEEPYPSIFEGNNKFIPIIEKQKALTKSQAKELIDLLTSTTTYGEATAACFNPHLAFVFYNNELPVLTVNICLDCNYLIASEKIPAMEFKKINKGTENEYSAEGFSRKGKARIKRLGKQLDFYYGHIE